MGARTPRSPASSRWHLVFGKDNGEDMLGPHTRQARTERERRYFDWRFTAADGGPHPATCTGCGRKIDPSYLDPRFRLGRSRLDLSSTNDGYVVASSTFRDACAGEHGAGLEFVALPAQPERFIVRATRRVIVDRNSPGLRLLYPCRVCKEYAGVFGVSHLRLSGADCDASGFWCTDLAFAQAHQQMHVLVVGEPTARWLKGRKFKGLDVSPLKD